MDLTIIAAVARNRVIGKNGRIPWRLHDDLARFRQLTTGQAVVMGRKTYESIGRPLPGRQNVVLSRNRNWWPQYPGLVLVAATFDEAVRLSAGKKLFVIGGAEVYALALPHTTQMFLTEVEADVPGDTIFPFFDKHDWAIVSKTRHEKDARNDFPFYFTDYRRW
jgi:dihydrofolate reductase